MNYSAHASVLVGKAALERARVSELLEALPDLPERLKKKEAAVQEVEGYLLLRLYITKEGEVWDAARALGGFALEAGPDSGGPGWAGTNEESFELLPHNLPALGKVLEAWKRANPPVGEGGLEAFLALVREAAGEVA